LTLRGLVSFQIILFFLSKFKNSVFILFLFSSCSLLSLLRIRSSSSSYLKIRLRNLLESKFFEIQLVYFIFNRSSGSLSPAYHLKFGSLKCIFGQKLSQCIKNGIGFSGAWGGNKEPARGIELSEVHIRNVGVPNNLTSEILVLILVKIAEFNCSLVNATGVDVNQGKEGAIRRPNHWRGLFVFVFAYLVQWYAFPGFVVDWHQDHHE
jgi:hypothetical protein